MFPTFCSAAVLLCSSVSAQTVQDPAGQVNPLIGTGISTQLDFGNVSPGATLPFGMLYWSPDPVGGQFYNHREPVTRGFSLTHLSGPGCGVFGDLPILPLLGTLQSPPPVQPMAYRAAFSHAHELLLGDHPLRIVAPGAPDKLYVKSFALDGSPIHNWWIDWSRLSKAGELVFTLTGAPDKSPGSPPPSYPAPKADAK